MSTSKESTSSSVGNSHKEEEEGEEEELRPPTRRRRGRKKMSLVARITEQYSELWRAIIRPPRDVYNLKDLGPRCFPMGERLYKRQDFELTNPRGLKLQCSHFEPVPEYRVAERLPCVVYLHGNCSSRVESLGSLHTLLPLHVTVLGIDLAGSGHSEGEFVSLGWHEREDLKTVIEYLRGSGTVSCIGLWGRSMGAVTSLLHGDRDPSLAGMVLDSPFSSLRTLSEELTGSFVRWKVPNFVVGGVLNLLKNTIQQKAHFDIDKLVPIDHVKQTFIPALFIAADQDNFIRPHHSKLLYNAYNGDKHIIIVEGDHNSARPRWVMDSIGNFFYRVLQCESIEAESQKRTIPSELRRKLALRHKEASLVRAKSLSSQSENPVLCRLSSAVTPPLPPPELSPPRERKEEDPREDPAAIAIEQFLSAAHGSASGEAALANLLTDDLEVSSTLARDAEPTTSPIVMRPPDRSWAFNETGLVEDDYDLQVAIRLSLEEAKESS